VLTVIPTSSAAPKPARLPTSSWIRCAELT
jgi:hypothetical protein